MNIFETTFLLYAIEMFQNDRKFYHKDEKINFNIKEKLNEIASEATCKDIDEFLQPTFRVNEKRRKIWRITQDGHGKWREINVDKVKENRQDKSLSQNFNLNEENNERQTKIHDNALSFSNNALNSNKNTLRINKRRSSKIQNYQTISTNTRANIFPGVGKQTWQSQTNNIHTTSALTLGNNELKLKDEFYGITRDALGVWNEASVHHEKIKKAWDIYLSQTLSQNKRDLQRGR